MLTASREPKNIPISISLLHEIEYKNICLVYGLNNKQIMKRRAFTERSKNTTNKVDSPRRIQTSMLK